MSKISLTKSEIDLLTNTGEDVTLGSKTLKIRPLPLGSLPNVIKDIYEIHSDILEIIKKENGNIPSCVEPIANFIIREKLSVASELTGLETESFKLLPAVMAFDILLTALDVNLEASGDMIKKLIALANKSKHLADVWGALNQNPVKK